MIFLQPQNRKVRRKRTPPAETDEGLCMGILQTLLNLGFIVLVFLIASSRGDWIVDIVRYFQSRDNTTNALVLDAFIPSIQWPEFKRVQNLPKYLLYSALLSVVSYNILTGLWAWLFRSGKQKQGYGDIEEDSTIFNDVILSSCNVALGSVVCALVSWYTPNKEYTQIYNDVSTRGWIYFSVSIPALFLYHEILTYYRHRMLHSSILYRTVHFWRHWPQQTTWSLMMMHPVECIALFIQSILPIYLFPIHIAVYLLMTTYSVYSDLMFHSTENMFQQIHRRYKNVNFGAISVLMDWACGTLRRETYDGSFYFDPRNFIEDASYKED